MDKSFSKKELDMLDNNAAYSYKLGEDKSRILGMDWFRGDSCNFIPSLVNLKEEDAINKYILKGWTPVSPIIAASSYVTAFGSCFAQHIRKYLRDKTQRFVVKSKALPIIHFGEGINTTFAIRQQFDWAWNNCNFEESLWYSKTERVEPTEDNRIETRAIFDKTDVFILTLGLSEVWSNKVTKEVFWRGIPKEQFNPEIHEFRVSTVSENLENLQHVVQTIKANNTTAKIIFTLSPVPLVATFRPVSCVTANTVSKAILRVAVDELMRINYSDVYYWPAYEIIKEWQNGSPYEEDNRHIRQEVVQVVLDKFSQSYIESKII